LRYHISFFCRRELVSSVAPPSVFFLLFPISTCCLVVHLFFVTYRDMSVCVRSFIKNVVCYQFPTACCVVWRPQPPSVPNLRPCLSPPVYAPLFVFFVDTPALFLRPVLLSSVFFVARPSPSRLWNLLSIRLFVAFPAFLVWFFLCACSHPTLRRSECSLFFRSYVVVLVLPHISVVCCSGPSDFSLL